MPSTCANTRCGSPRVTLEHEAPIALGDKLEILAHTHLAGSTDRFGAELADRAVRTLTYVVGDHTKAIASIFALWPRAPIEPRPSD